MAIDDCDFDVLACAVETTDYDATRWRFSNCLEPDASGLRRRVRDRSMCSTIQRLKYNGIDFVNHAVIRNHVALGYVSIVYGDHAVVRGNVQ